MAPGREFKSVGPATDIAYPEELSLSLAVVRETVRGPGQVVTILRRRHEVRVARLTKM